MYLIPSLLLGCGTSVSAFAPHHHALQFQRVSSTSAISSTSRITQSSTQVSMSEWSDFKDLDDDDDDLYNDDLPPAGKMTESGYADENDPQEFKAEIGSKLPVPEIDWDGDPIFLPVGSALPLTEENVQGVLQACRQEIGTMFGYTAENRGVGITGGVDFVDFDGPTVILRVHGRFWHQRTTVLDRVGMYLQGRIPEIVDYMVDDPYELTDDANNKAD